VARRACIAILAATTAACASLRGPELEAELEPSLELPAPSAVRARSGELRAVPLSWQAVLGREVAGYAVERAAGEGEAFVRITVVPGQFAAAHVDRSPELRDGEIYRYVVRSVAADGRVGVATSPVASATTATPPGPPPELEAYSHQPRRVALQWRASPDATVVGYRVERAASAEGPFTTLASSQGRFATTYVDEGLGDLRVLYYRVAAVNAAGEPGEPGKAVRAVTKAEPLPPLGLRIADKGLGRNALAWEPNVETDISAYRLERLRADTHEPELVAELAADAVSAEDVAIGSGEIVTYRLYALDADGLESSPSDPVEVQSERYDLRAEPGPGGVALHWNARSPEGFAAARIYRVDRLRQRELARVEGDRFVDAQVRSGRRYRYAVVLERADGSQAPPSDVVQVEVPAE
jgi:fibronectin type 3 domain-containing protein